jgi:aminoglycoside phosphotransferase family enzyme/predicted kinase
MELTGLIEQLSEPGAYPFPTADIEVRQTHISVVFLAGPYAYKIKKPVAFGFLNFRTLPKRRYFCEEEVRLNRRLAPAVYLGVVPITRSGPGLQVEGTGEVVEWAVKMQRLPHEATLQERLLRGELESDLVCTLARRIAAFHAQAESGETIAALGRFEVVAGNARENLEQAASQVETTVHPSVFGRLRSLTEAALLQLRPVIDQRAANGVPRDTHGDLRLDHIYFLPERPPPGDLVIIDCIEFNERFRFADPVADMAFVVMDLLFHGRKDLATAFADEYVRISHDEEGQVLLPFYTAYRAVVRGKVEGLELAEKEIPEAERAAALARARAHWLLALGELEEPRRRPCLVLVGGLPGTGKSSLAAALAECAGFQIVRSDIVRKQLAGAAAAPTAQGFEAGIYTQSWTERTYAECLRRAEKLLFEGQRVLVDATFRDEGMRRTFVQSALRRGVPAVLLLCQAEPEIVRERLENRRGDASDADWNIHLQAALHWEEPTAATRRHLRSVRTGDRLEAALAQALDALREVALAS